MASRLWRALVIAHRYLGIAVGVLMLMWFASGIVMMYVAFPQGIGNERLGALRLIAWDIVMIVLLLGGVGVCATGVYLAIRRISVDAAALPRLWRTAPTQFVAPETVAPPPEP